jgi:hypothetical protein
VTLMNSASNVVVVLLSLVSAAKTQSPLRSHAISLAIENRMAWEAAAVVVSFAAAVLLLLIVCGIIAELFIAGSLFVSAIVGIRILFILPDKTRVPLPPSSSLLLSSWLNAGAFRPDGEASNAISRIEKMVAAILEDGAAAAIVLCLMLDMKKIWLAIVFRGFDYH